MTIVADPPGRLSRRRESERVLLFGASLRREAVAYSKSPPELDAAESIPRLTTRVLVTRVTGTTRAPPKCDGDTRDRALYPLHRGPAAPVGEVAVRPTLRYYRETQYYQRYRAPGER